MDSQMPYIGCKIALISRAQNRYEGILYTIDKANSTVVLAKVKCFGTERRPADRPTAPKADIYEYITFRGSDIKDISLCEPPQSQYGLFPDPAIVESSGTSTSETCSILNVGPIKVPVYHQVSAHSQSLLSEDHALGLGLPIRRGPMVEKAVQTIGLERSRQSLSPLQEKGEKRRQQVIGPVGEMPRRDPPHVRNPIMTRTGGQSFPHAQQERAFWQNIENIPPRRRYGASGGRNPQRKPFTANVRSGPTLRFDTDFDFDLSNAKFVKEALEYDMQQMENVKDDSFGQKCFYNRATSFYDSISSDWKLRLTWAEERRRNLETFGAPGRIRRSQDFRGGYARGRGQRPGPVVSAN